MDYEKKVKIFKALSDLNRLKIVEMLSHGERNACEILKYFEITQPTLSHHMKVLCDCGLINIRKEGNCNYYTINTDNCNGVKSFVSSFLKEDININVKKTI